MRKYRGATGPGRCDCRRLIESLVTRAGEGRRREDEKCGREASLLKMDDDEREKRLRLSMRRMTTRVQRAKE